MKRSLRIVLLLTFVAFTAASVLRGNGGWDKQPEQTPQGAAASPQGKKTDHAVRFIAFGDMGTGDRNQYALAKRMAAWHDEDQYDTALLLGDNIYPDGNPDFLPAKFEKPYAELLRRGVRFYAALGNHDVKKGRDAQINYPNFNMGGQAYYSFIKGDGVVEFFALDSTNFDLRQERWLEGALAVSKATWKLAYFHHPIYSSSKTHGSDKALRARLEPLFVRYGVAAVFSGHDHIYERTKPQQGVQYFISGAGSGKLRRGDIDRKSTFFAAGNDETSSFIFVEVTRDRFSFKAIDAAGVIFDSGVLTPTAMSPQSDVRPINKRAAAH